MANSFDIFKQISSSEFQSLLNAKVSNKLNVWKTAKPLRASRPDFYFNKDPENLRFN